MASQPTPLNWLRIVVAVVVGYLASFLTLFCVISTFAALLAVQARGAPDQAQINAFANQHSAWIGSLTLLLAAVAASFWATRKLEPASAQMHGPLVQQSPGRLARRDEESPRLALCHPLLQSARCGGDPAHPLQKIQRRPLVGQ